MLGPPAPAAGIEQSQVVPSPLPSLVRCVQRASIEPSTAVHSGASTARMNCERSSAPLQVTAPLCTA